MHAEKRGDGGLTGAERETLGSADNVTLVTIPGAVFLLPDEAPSPTAAVIAEALKATWLATLSAEGNSWAAPPTPGGDSRRGRPK